MCSVSVACRLFVKFHEIRPEHVLPPYQMTGLFVHYRDLDLFRRLAMVGSFARSSPLLTGDEFRAQACGNKAGDIRSVVAPPSCPRP